MHAQFVVTYDLALDTLMVHELQRRNSGRPGGLFLVKGKHRRPDKNNRCLLRGAEGASVEGLCTSARQGSGNLLALPVKSSLGSGEGKPTLALKRCAVSVISNLSQPQESA